MVKLSNEEWKCIEGYEGKYFVSNLGRIMNSKNHIMKPRLDKDGYELINLYSNKNSRTFKVHRLVASAFIENGNLLENEVNHKDEIKSNNKVENLEWCDHIYNNRYGSKPGKISDKNSKEVLQFDLNGNFIRSHKSTMKIQRDLGFRHSNISACCRGLYKRMYGYIWKYAKESVV